VLLFIFDDGTASSQCELLHKMVNMYRLFVADRGNSPIMSMETESNGWLVMTGIG